MSAHVLLNLLNKLWKKIKCETLPCILSVFPSEFNKSFSYQDTPPLSSLLVCILNFDNKTSKIFSKCNHLS